MKDWQTRGGEILTLFKNDEKKYRSIIEWSRGRVANLFFFSQGFFLHRRKTEEPNRCQSKLSIPFGVWNFSSFSSRSFYVFSTSSFSTRMKISSNWKKNRKKRTFDISFVGGFSVRLIIALTAGPTDNLLNPFYPNQQDKIRRNETKVSQKTRLIRQKRGKNSEENFRAIDSNLLVEKIVWKDPNDHTEGSISLQIYC